MKDENGIEIKCENCALFDASGKPQCFYEDTNCNCNGKDNTEAFEPSRNAYEARIRELTEEKDDLKEGMNIGYWLGRHDATHAKPRAKRLDRLVADCAESTVANNATVADCAEYEDKDQQKQVFTTSGIEPKTCDDCWLRRDFGMYIPAGYCANGKCAKIYNLFNKESGVRNG